MTISSTNRKAGPFIGNDSASAFPFAFEVFAAADVYAVQLNTATGVESALTLGTDYTVALNADQVSNPGGTLTLTAAPLASGRTLTLTSNVSPLQLTDLTNQGGFYPRVITRALDKLTVLVQQLFERLGRSLTLPLSASAGVSTALPVPEANKALVWNSTATGLSNYDANQFATSVIGTNRVVDRFLANGTAGPYALNTDPLTINNTLVFVGGSYRAHNTYSISGASITFTAAVAADTVVEVVQQLAVTYPVTALSDNVVSTGKVIDDAVTLAKLAAAVQNLINGALQRAGGILTGPVELAGDATDDLHPVPLQQVQALIAAARTVPSGTVIAAMRATIPAGWLPLTGGTIGGAASGGTARANADTWPLFEEVWAASSNVVLPIQTSAGAGTARGASAAADFAANKRLPLPNVRDGDALLAAVTSGVCGLSIGEVISHNHAFTATQIVGGSQGAGGNPALPQNVTWGTSPTGGTMNRAAGLFTKFLVAL